MPRNSNKLNLNHRSAIEHLTAAVRALEADSRPRMAAFVRSTLEPVAVEGDQHTLIHIAYSGAEIPGMARTSDYGDYVHTALSESLGEGPIPGGILHDLRLAATRRRMGLSSWTGRVILVHADAFDPEVATARGVPEEVWRRQIESVVSDAERPSSPYCLRVVRSEIETETPNLTVFHDMDFRGEAFVENPTKGMARHPLEGVLGQWIELERYAMSVPESAAYLQELG